MLRWREGLDLKCKSCRPRNISTKKNRTIGGTCMTTDANIAKQAIQDEFESQIKAAEAELELLAGRAEGAMVKAEVEAYETLLPKLLAIQQKLKELKKSTGAQWGQTKADLELLIGDFKELLKEIALAAKAN